jgi:uncharacterized phage protein (TIGR02218 family)
MKSASTALAAHLVQGQTTLATCWKVTRTDGVVQGFTDHDQDLVIDGVTYLASSGFSRLNLSEKNSLEAANLQADGMINLGPSVSIPGLAHCWPFDEGAGAVAGDSVAGIDGTWQGTLGAQWIPGKVGRYAGGFDSTTNYIALASSVALGSSFTVAVWLKPSNLAVPGNDGYYAILGGNHLFLSPSGALNFFAGGDDHLSALTIPAGVWSHVAFVMAAGALSFYVNGVLDANTYAGLSGFSSLYLGVTGPPNTELFPGAMDDLRVYNRALSAVEVGELMAPRGMTAADLRARKYDYADVVLFAVNWADLTEGIITLLTGKFGAVTINENGFQVQLDGLAARLATIRGDLYQPTCRVDLGSAECGVNMDPLMQSGTVATTDGVRNLTATGLTADDGYFNGGCLTWLTGANAGDSVEVKTFSASGEVLVLYLKAREPITVGDTFKVAPGCDKLISTCRSKFNNVVNFRGEPYIPGIDYLLTIPEYKGSPAI